MSLQSWMSSRTASIWASRAVITCAWAACALSYFFQPESALGWTFDAMVRAYLHFVLGAMAHEASHGHLGRTKNTNLWWGRLALIPSTVPYVSFRKTHVEHHRHTNERDADPDEFLNTPHAWQVPLRALAMPHHWLTWLWRRGQINRAFLTEYALSYTASGLFFLALASQVGWERVVLGYVPAGVLHALLLWYPFAIKTHEGYSIGGEAERSHNYQGRLAYWFSFGLSLHRVHHEKPHLGWLQMAERVPHCSWREALTFRRDIRTTASRS